MESICFLGELSTHDVHTSQAVEQVAAIGLGPRIMGVRYYNHKGVVI